MLVGVEKIIQSNRLLTFNLIPLLNCPRERSEHFIHCLVSKFNIYVILKHLKKDLLTFQLFRMNTLAIIYAPDDCHDSSVFIRNN